MYLSLSLSLGYTRLAYVTCSRIGKFFYLVSCKPFHWFKDIPESS